MLARVSFRLFVLLNVMMMLSYCIAGMKNLFMNVISP